MNEIHNAVRISDLDAIAHSLKAGRDVNARNEMGFTPLHELCMCSGDVAMAEFLLHHGARAEARDGRGRTPALRRGRRVCRVASVVFVPGR